MKRPMLGELLTAFLAEYSDPEIDPRLFFDVWTDRRGLADSLAERLWRAVAPVLLETRPEVFASRRRLACRR